MVENWVPVENWQPITPEANEAEAAKQVNQFMTGDSTFVPNIAKGAAEIPSAVAEYAKTATPSKVGSDIYQFGKTFAKEAYQHPISTAASFVPGVSETMAFSDISKLNDAINQLDAAGQNSKADELRKYLPITAASMIPGLSTLARGPARAAETALRSLTPEMRAAATAAGYSASDIEALAPQLMQTMSQKGVIPEAASEARFGEFGVRPTYGQVTGDPVQIGREKFLENQKLQSFMASQPAAMQSAAEEMINSPYNLDKLSQLPVTASQDALTTLKSRAAQAKGLSEAEYAKFYGMRGSVEPQGLAEFGDRVRAGIDPEELPDEVAHPITSRALDIINDRMKGIADAGNQYAEKTGPLTSGSPNAGVISYTSPVGPTQTGFPLLSSNVVQSTLQGIESVRKNLNRLYPAASEKEASQFGAVMNSFDNQVEQLVNSPYFSGDPKAPEAIAAARDLWSKYKTNFGVQGKGDDAGRLIDGLIAGAKNTTDIQNALLNLSSSGNTKGTAVRLYDRINSAIGKTDPEVMAGINSAIKQQILTSAKTSPEASFADIAKRIDSNLSGSARPLMNRIFDPTEIEQLERYSTVSKKLAQQGVPANENTIRNAIVNAGFRLGSSAAGYLTGGHNILEAIAGGAMGKTAGDIAGKVSQSLQSRSAMQGLPPISAPTGFPAYSVVRPQEQQVVPQQATGGRAGHKSGGKVGGLTAESLLRDLKRRQVMLASKTEHMLSLPDDAVVQALDAAKR
jgi:hypothetical protein